MAYQDHLVPVLDAMKARLETWGIFPEVGLSLDEEPKLLAKAKFTCNLLPSEGVTIPETVEGCGRWFSGYIDYLHVQVYTQCALDTFFTNTIQLTDDTLGIMSKSQEVFDCLQLFMPFDDDGNALAVEPMRILRQDPPRPYKKDPQWVYVTLVFEVLNKFNLDPEGP